MENTVFSKSVLKSRVSRKKLHVLLKFVSLEENDWFILHPFHSLDHSMTVPSVILVQMQGLACWKCFVRSEQ